MKKVIIIYKQIGETPLEALEKARIEHGISKHTPMTYAGRLDPLAEGALLILIGEECKKKEEYLNMDKEYEVEILLGIQTDTYDPLGLITGHADVHEKEMDFSKYICKFDQTYPAYSSKIISMKEVPEILPTNQVEIYSIEKVEEKEIGSNDLHRQIIEKISKVKGEFRQKIILKKWSDFFINKDEMKFNIVKIKARCTSGTYMRSLADRIGGLAFSIKRTKIGGYSI